MGASIEDIRTMRPWVLSKIAECMEPDSDTSAGALMLASVRDAVLEGIEDGRFIADQPDRDDYDGACHQIADDAPDIYTHTRWAEFSDLGAYQEEPECGEWPNDLNDTAGVALYQIAQRLVYGLLSEWREWLADVERCDECDAAVPADASTQEGDWHDDSCSLHAANITTP